MADLHTHIVEIVDKHLKEWRDPDSGAPVVAPGSSHFWVAELAQKLMAEVARHRSDSYGPASGRVPAGQMRTPDLPGRRLPGEDLGTEALPT